MQHRDKALAIRQNRFVVGSMIHFGYITKEMGMRKIVGGIVKDPLIVGEFDKLIIDIGARWQTIDKCILPNGERAICLVQSEPDGKPLHICHCQDSKWLLPLTGMLVSPSHYASIANME